jgi:hypothetical protein
MYAKVFKMSSDETGKSRWKLMTFCLINDYGYFYLTPLSKTFQLSQLEYPEKTTNFPLRNLITYKGCIVIHDWMTVELIETIIKRVQFSWLFFTTEMFLKVTLNRNIHNHWLNKMSLIFIRYNTILIAISYLSNVME